MLARNWKKICIFILIVACLFNVVIKLVKRISFNKEILSSARYTAIQHQYETEEGSNKVKGYNGMEPDQWKSEWISLGREYSLNIKEETVAEISLCVMSILQFSTYDDELGHKGTIYLLQSDDRQLRACTLEDGLSQPYVTFFVLDNVDFKKMYSSRLIDDPVLVVRNESGEAVLQNEAGERIL